MPSASGETTCISPRMKDATRINVVDESSLPRLRQEATMLARRLGVPLWDATLPPEVLAA